MKTYDIKAEFFALKEMLENDEVNEETGEVIDNSEALQELLSDLEGERDEKADNIAYLIKQTNDTQKAIKAEIDRLNDRRKMYVRQEESLKQLLDFLLGGEKLKTAKFTYSYRTTQSVNITDLDLIPAEYLNVKETFTPDKTAIKKALQDFTDIPGAEIEIKTSLGVR